MGDVVNLRSIPIDLDSEVGHQFIVDATRAAEGLITDRELAEKYELSPADWQAITKDKALGHAIRAERERRVRSGTAVKEAAAKHLVKGPGILDQIMTNTDSNPRHKIEAFKELRQTATIGDNAEGLPESDRFIITINLGADNSGADVVEHYNKSRAIDPNDTDPNDIKINVDGSHGDK
jgi:hypothetical protein